MSDPRFQLLEQWLTSELKSGFDLTPIVGDASFRRYFRVACHGDTFIAADAPPDKEDSYSFVAVGRAFAAININVPKIFSFDLQNGFLLLSDFGNDLYQHVLNTDNADLLYGRSLEELLKIQGCQHISHWKMPCFDADFMGRELANFRHWFLEQHLQITVNGEMDKCLNRLFEMLINSAVTQPKCCIHRDYHSRNLLVLPNSVGVLDFQDAALGPITYDLVSLLRDCYIVWPLQNVRRWALLFYERLIEKRFLAVSEQVFLRWFDWMGVQRHLKAIFIFARKYHRDAVTDYLPYIANGLQYVTEVIESYPEFKAFYRWMRDEILPRYEMRIAS